MAKVKTRIGLDLYVFTEARGHAPACVISAHGFYRAGDPNYDPLANDNCISFARMGVVADIGNVGQANIANPPYTAIRGHR